ncbi:MAG: hypothetical protein IJ486_02780 [Firmicutes bacterium]|nr:hypothetical protein [Bacillota bacterium]
MDRNRFKVIKGGNESRIENREFVAAYITDTRLMGVVGLRIHWEIKEAGVPMGFHQFFYFDAEEYGLDSYKSYRGDDESAVEAMEDAMFGGLGGQMIPLTEQEARFLVQDFCRDSQMMGVRLPEPREEYAFLLENEIGDDPWLLRSIVRKMCVELQSDYELVHYFLMRSYGKDKKGLSYVSDMEGIESGRIEDVAEPYGATLYKNTIEEFINEDGSTSYLSESLVEVDHLNQYRLIMTEVQVGDNKVISAKRRSAFTVTTQEVAMMLSRPEFVTVFEVLAQEEDANNVLEEILTTAMKSRHDNGKLYMVFHQNNEHVNRRIFRLNDDIQSLFYMTDFGQLIVGAYTLPAIWEAERKLQKSKLGMVLMPTAKFEFKEPVLLDFVQSDYEDFEDFLEDIKGEQ